MLAPALMFLHGSNAVNAPVVHSKYLFGYELPDKFPFHSASIFNEFTTIDRFYDPKPKTKESRMKSVFISVAKRLLPMRYRRKLREYRVSQSVRHLSGPRRLHWLATRQL